MNKVIDLTDLSDIDEKLMSELKFGGINQSDQQIMELFIEYKTLNIDQILVGLFRKFGISKKRSWVTNRLCALKKYSDIYSVCGKRGTFSIK